MTPSLRFDERLIVYSSVWPPPTYEKRPGLSLIENDCPSETFLKTDVTCQAGFLYFVGRLCSSEDSSLSPKQTTSYRECCIASICMCFNAPRSARNRSRVISCRIRNWNQNCKFSFMEDVVLMSLANRLAQKTMFETAPRTSDCLTNVDWLCSAFT